MCKLYTLLNNFQIPVFQSPHILLFSETTFLIFFSHLLEKLRKKFEQNLRFLINRPNVKSCFDSILFNLKISRSGLKVFIQKRRCSVKERNALCKKEEIKKISASKMADCELRVVYLWFYIKIVLKRPYLVLKIVKTIIKLV